MNSQLAGLLILVIDTIDFSVIPANYPTHDASEFIARGFIAKIKVFHSEDDPNLKLSKILRRQHRWSIRLYRSWQQIVMPKARVVFFVKVLVQTADKSPLTECVVAT